MRFFSDLVGLQYFCCSWTIPVILRLSGLGQSLGSPKKLGQRQRTARKGQNLLHWFQEFLLRKAHLTIQLMFFMKQDNTPV